MRGWDDDAVVTVATNRAAVPRDFMVDFGLTQPGTKIALKVYVLTTTGRERGSAVNGRPPGPERQGAPEAVQTAEIAVGKPRRGFPKSPGGLRRRPPFSVGTRGAASLPKRGNPRRGFPTKAWEPAARLPYRTEPLRGSAGLRSGGRYSPPKNFRNERKMLCGTERFGPASRSEPARMLPRWVPQGSRGM